MVPVTVSAVVTWPDGLPFRGVVEFTTKGGRVLPERVKADFTGTAKTSLTANSGEMVTVTASAPGVTQSLSVSFADPTSPDRSDWPQPPAQLPPTPVLVFRNAPANTPTNSPMRPAPIAAVEIINGDPLANRYGMEALITLNVTSCPALLDPASELTVSTIGGVAVFENITFTTPATGCQLVATSPGFRFRESARFDVLP